MQGGVEPISLTKALKKLYKRQKDKQFPGSQKDTRLPTQAPGSTKIIHVLQYSNSIVEKLCFRVAEYAPIVCDTRITVLIRVIK